MPVAAGRGVIIGGSLANQTKEPSECLRAVVADSISRPISMDGAEIEVGGTPADVSTVGGPFFDRLAEVEPDEDA